MENPIEATLLSRPVLGANGWHKFADNTDIDAALEIMAFIQASPYAQIASAEEIEVVSANGADTTQYITIFGIDNADGNQTSERIGPLTGATAVTTTTVFRYYEGALLDKECAGAVTIRKKTGDTFISGIAIGSLTDYVCQHFNGEKTTYITYFDAGLDDNATDTVTFDLRWYPDDADCLDAGDGFIILDRIVAHGVAIATSAPGGLGKAYAQPIRCPAGGWIAVYALAGQDNCEGFVTLQGFDYP